VGRILFHLPVSGLRWGDVDFLYRVGDRSAGGGRVCFLFPGGVVGWHGFVVQYCAVAGDFGGAGGGVGRQLCAARDGASGAGNCPGRRAGRTGDRGGPAVSGDPDFESALELAGHLNFDGINGIDGMGKQGKVSCGGRGEHGGGRRWNRLSNCVPRRSLETREIGEMQWSLRYSSTDPEYLDSCFGTMMTLFL
jgi:hypothetical protein